MEMARAYSLDLRERVVATVATTSPRSPRSLLKWSRPFGSSGLPNGFARPAIQGRGQWAAIGPMRWLLKRLSKQPDVTLRALLAELADRGIKGQLLRGLAFSSTKASVSKKTCARANRIGRRRAAARAMEKYQGGLDPSRLVFIDETWAKTNMTRSHGRSPLGPGSAEVRIVAISGRNPKEDARQVLKAASAKSATPIRSARRTPARIELEMK
jgi:hypothetical protein